jgi:hypothetical protein
VAAGLIEEEARVGEKEVSLYVIGPVRQVGLLGHRVSPWATSGRPVSCRAGLINDRLARGPWAGPTLAHGEPPGAAAAAPPRSGVRWPLPANPPELEIFFIPGEIMFPVKPLEKKEFRSYPSAGSTAKSSQERSVFLSLVYSSPVLLQSRLQSPTKPLPTLTLAPVAILRGGRCATVCFNPSRPKFLWRPVSPFGFRRIE